jgi:hypothetical protein
MDEGDMYRASGDCVCETCGKLYYDHPYFTEPYEFLTICNGDIVKLSDGWVQ